MARGTFDVGSAAVPLAALVSYVSALRPNCPPQIWNLAAEPPMGQGPCAVGRDDASVGVAAAAVRALGVCASVTMPAVNGMRASSVEALDTAIVEYVTVTPTARAEHASAARMWTAASVPKEGSAAGMDTANATVASARMATMGSCVTSASAASHHVSNTGIVQSVGPLALAPWQPIAAWPVPM